MLHHCSGNLYFSVLKLKLNRCFLHVCIKLSVLVLDVLCELVIWLDYVFRIFTAWKFFSFSCYLYQYYSLEYFMSDPSHSPWLQYIHALSTQQPCNTLSKHLLPIKKISNSELLAASPWGKCMTWAATHIPVTLYAVKLPQSWRLKLMVLLYKILNMYFIVIQFPVPFSIYYRRGSKPGEENYLH